MLSAMDDYLGHQIAEPSRFVATGDRNFYDRYYFNVHSCSDEFFLIVGMGQYPNLGTHDAFAVLRVGQRQYVLRSSKILEDRLDSSCGPVRVEVLAGLKQLRVTIGSNPSGIEADFVFSGSHAAQLEPRQFDRRHGRIYLDVLRFGQSGNCEGWIKIPNAEFRSEGKSWRGYRDRSWGIRQVGEAEPAGINAYNPGGAAGQALNWRWFYTAAAFDDFSLMIKIHEDNDGSRYLEEALRLWNDGRKPEHLGKVKVDCKLDPSKRFIENATITCQNPGEESFVVNVQQLLPIFLEAETGYGRTKDRSWTHGQFRGEEVTDALDFDLGQSDPRLYGAIDSVARFEVNGKVGYGLLEYIFFGRFDRFDIQGPGYWNATA